MDNIKESLENKVSKNKYEDDSDIKKAVNIDVNIKTEKKDESQKLSIKDSSILLKDINHIFNVSVNITVQLGHAKITIQDLLNISTGSVIILDKLIGEPLDILVNGSLIATGEIVVEEDKYGIRVISVLNTSKNVGF